ncbi:MAG: alkaline phosphatase D family protein [Pyrinomonadaceae bacterium]
MPPGQQIFYRVAFQDNLNPKISSAPVTGMLRTPPRGRRDLLFAWSGDTAGQGWGINPDWGGMKIFEAIRNLQPDFFIHSGDTIYADGPLQAEVRLDDNSIWKNIVTAEKSKVAETLDEFRGQYRYNLLDENLRRFNAEVPQFVQWDDHETYNNWFPGRILDDPRYKVRDCRVLAARSKRAFLDYQPIRFNPRDPQRIFRAYNYGSSLDLLMLDERSYRGRNSPNRQTTASGQTAFWVNLQMRWLKSRLLASRST